MRLLLALIWVVLGASEALACSFTPDERPWEVRLGDQPSIFVGRVIAVLDAEGMKDMGYGACEPAYADPMLPRPTQGRCAILRIEQPIRNARGRTYEVPQGQGGNCGIVYEVGQYWLYAGWFIGGPSQQLVGPLSRAQLSAIKRAVGAR